MGERTSSEQSGSPRSVHAKAMTGGPAIYVTAGGGGGSIDVDQARDLIGEIVAAIVEIGGRRI